MNTSNDDIQKMQAKIEELRAEAEAITNDLKETHERIGQKMNAIDSKVHEGAQKIDSLSESLDKAEREAESELDALVAKDAEDTAKG